MQCIDCRFSQAKREVGEGYFLCTKQNKEVYPYNYCSMSKEFKDEQRAIEIYMDKYQENTVEEIVKMIGRRSIDVVKMNYLINKHFLPKEAK